MNARRVVVRGVVQGVGFRPHVLRLAETLGVNGTCRNDATSVIVEAEGAAGTLDDFVRRLVDDAPPLARVLDVTTDDLAPTGRSGFAIIASTVGSGARTMVPPDTAVCADCL